ncbi:MAG: hypothetical protein AAGJ87_05745 [Pseudomonadota bacterium]
MARRDRDYGPHYIPELDPENRDNDLSGRAIFLALFSELFFILLAIAGVAVGAGLIATDVNPVLRISVAVMAVLMLIISTILVFRTNRPKE